MRSTQNRRCAESQCGGTIPSLKGPDVRKGRKRGCDICAGGSKFPLFPYIIGDGMGMVINPIVGVDKPIIYEDFL